MLVDGVGVFRVELVLRHRHRHYASREHVVCSVAQTHFLHNKHETHTHTHHTLTRPCGLGLGGDCVLVLGRRNVSKNTRTQPISIRLGRLGARVHGQCTNVYML